MQYAATPVKTGLRILGFLLVVAHVTVTALPCADSGSEGAAHHAEAAIESGDAHRDCHGGKPLHTVRAACPCGCTKSSPAGSNPVWRIGQAILEDDVAEEPAVSSLPWNLAAVTAPTAPSFDDDVIPT